MASLLDFIKSVSQTDDIQDVSAQTVGGKVTFSTGGRSAAVTPPPGYRPVFGRVSHLGTEPGNRLYSA